MPSCGMAGSRVWASRPRRGISAAGGKCLTHRDVNTTNAPFAAPTRRLLHDHAIGPRFRIAIAGDLAWVGGRASRQCSGIFSSLITRFAFARTGEHRLYRSKARKDRMHSMQIPAVTRRRPEAVLGRLGPDVPANRRASEPLRLDGAVPWTRQSRTERLASRPAGPDSGQSTGLAGNQKRFSTAIYCVTDLRTAVPAASSAAVWLQPVPVICDPSGRQAFPPVSQMIGRRIPDK